MKGKKREREKYYLSRFIFSVVILYVGLTRLPLSVSEELSSGAMFLLGAKSLALGNLLAESQS